MKYWPRQVYFLRRADGVGPIKIGCSRYPDERRLQIGYFVKHPILLLASAPGGYGDEREIHRQFADHRTVNPDLPTRPYSMGGSEWFAPVPELLALIEHVATTRALPTSCHATRDTTIFNRRATGETLQSIASDFGISRERVRQIVDEMKRGIGQCQREDRIAA